MAKPWAAGDKLTAAELNSAIKFGGTGADGAKTVSASENLDAAGATYLVKNYTNLTIDAGQTWTLINPGTTYGTLVHIKCTGNLIINGTIDFKGAVGASGNKGNGFCITNADGGDGNAGSPASGSANGGNGGNGAAGINTKGTTGSTGTNNSANTANENYQRVWHASNGTLSYVGGRYILAWVGGKGGRGGSVTGGTGGGYGGDGGNGLIIEVLGNVTFGASSVINLSGGAGGTGGTGDGSYGEGGGGGGAGGGGVIIYNGTLTDSGLTKTVSGGAGGAAGGNGGAGGAAGNGLITVIANGVIS